MINIKHLLLAGIFGFIMMGCGPAAEDREAMYARAKVFQDSIANVIKQSMDEAAAPADQGVVVASPQESNQPAPNQ